MVDMVNNVSWAQESSKIQRARGKLEERLKEFDCILPKDLERKMIEIHDRIARHATDRIPTLRKSLSLFDNNENPAGVSRIVSSVAQRVFSNFKN